jgi:gamma-glutamylcyclotransferase (GGCT)/AIG2-like uncharacterized protein YtfP
MSGTEECRLLFVYGTLRRDSAHPMARWLAGVSRFLGHASVAGRLYDLGPYPGLVADDAAGRVWGHLLEMMEPESALDQLDAYEGCPLGEPIPALFRRGLLPVRAEDGTVHTAWVYTYHGEVVEEKRVTAGEYRPVAG